MKKLISLAIGLGLAVNAGAQNYRSFNLLNVQALQVTNNIGATNILQPWNTITTNVPGMIYTNAAGDRVIMSINGTTNNLDEVFKDAPLWSDRDGRAIGPTYANTALVATSTTNEVIQAISASYASLSVRWLAGAGADSAITVTIVPIVNDNGDESTIAGDSFIFSFTPVVSTVGCYLTNLPVYKWVGCKGLRVKKISYADATADSNVWIQGMKVSGFVP